jgi:type IV pilus assembly protein PilM
MAKTRIGIDVGSTAVRVAEVAAGDVPVLVRAAQVPLAPGVVEAGEVRQPEALAEALRELLSKSGVKTKQVFLGVGNQRVIVREVALPWLPEKELRDTLAFQVQEFIPMSADEAVLDFDPLGELDQGGRRMQRILLVAAHKGMINALVDAALGAKLDPVGIDLTPFAVIRAVGTGDEGLDLDSSGEEAIIDIGAQVTSITVHERGVTRFVRMLPSGGRDITLALASGLGVDEEAAERLKRGERAEPALEAVESPDAVDAGADTAQAEAPPAGPPDVEATGPTASSGDIPAAPEPNDHFGAHAMGDGLQFPEPVEAPSAEPPGPAAASSGGPDPADVRNLALARAGSFVDEVRSSLEFYAAQMPNARIGRVLVVGGGSRLDGLLELLQERLPVPVDRGRLFERAKSELDLSVEAAAEAEAVLSVAVGLAIPSRRPA